MDKGSKFERDGIRYIVLQDGIEHVARNKYICIRPEGESKCVTIKQALQDGLIRESGLFDKDDLFNKEDPGDRRKSPEHPTVEKQRPPDEYTQEATLRPKRNCIYFMPVDQLRAQVYLAHGLIYPTAYEKTGLSIGFDDSQWQSHCYLTLFETPQPIKKNQLLLKIILLPDEISSAEREVNALLLPAPIPISRLTGIEVSPDVGDINRYVDGWVKPDVPVPKHLFANATKKSDHKKEEPTFKSKGNGFNLNSELAKSISTFDRYLGVMAFLRNASRYFSERTGHYADYPDIFFAVCERVLGKQSISLSEHSTRVSPLLLALLDVELQNTPAMKTILGIVTSQDSYIEKEKARSCAMAIYEGTEENETVARAFKMLFNGDYKSAIQKLQNPDLPDEVAIFAGLFKFSGRQSNDHRTVKQRLQEDWTNQARADLFLSALGAYHGYTALNAVETSIYSAHPLIRPYIEERPDIKFHLKTKFERRMIEALYHRAFFPKEHIKDIEHLFDDVNAPPSSPRPRIPRLFVSDSTYTVHDLVVRQYEVTHIGRVVHLLRTLKRDTIDERSEAGKYLMAKCFFLSDEYELSKKGDKQILSYRISRKKAIDLIADAKITVNPHVLEAALKEDLKNNTR